MENHRMSAPAYPQSTPTPPATTAVVGAAANRLFELPQQADYAQAATMLSPGARVWAVALVRAPFNAQGSSKHGASGNAEWGTTML